MPKKILMLILRATSFSYILIAFAFGSVSPASAGSLEGFKQALKADDVEVVWGAVRKIPRKLSLEQKKEVIRLLTEALHKEWPRCTGDIRQSIALQLAHLQAKEAIPDILELIREGKDIEHRCAQCGCCYAYQSVSGFFGSIRQNLFCENSVLDALHSLATFSYAKEISELAESNTHYRPQLLVILGKIGHSRYAHFIAKFADTEPLAVAQALGKIKQQSGIPVLGRLLEHSKIDVCWEASVSLAHIGGERAVDTVKLRLNHPNKDVRALAARTLSVLGVDDGLPVLRDLARDEEAPKTRGMAIAYLGQLKDFESRPILLAGLKDKGLFVRAYSIYALGFVGDGSDIPAIEASLFESKSMKPATRIEKEGSWLIDETTRETLKQIRSR